MPGARIESSPVVASGAGHCEGGERPDPPIDGFPLLAYVDGVVLTEDGAATVRDVKLVVLAAADRATAVAYLGTTPEHVAQALAYADLAGVT